MSVSDEDVDKIMIEDDSDEEEKKGEVESEGQSPRKRSDSIDDEKASSGSRRDPNRRRTPRKKYSRVIGLHLV